MPGRPINYPKDIESLCDAFRQHGPMSRREAARLLDWSLYRFYSVVKEAIRLNRIMILCHTHRVTSGHAMDILDNAPGRLYLVKGRLCDCSPTPRRPWKGKSIPESKHRIQTYDPGWLPWLLGD